MPLRRDHPREMNSLKRDIQRMRDVYGCYITDGLMFMYDHRNRIYVNFKNPGEYDNDAMSVDMPVPGILYGILNSIILHIRVNNVIVYKKSKLRKAWSWITKI